VAVKVGTEREPLTQKETVSDISQITRSSCLRLIPQTLSSTHLIQQKSQRHTIARILMQPPSLLIAYALSASLHSRIKKGELFTQMTTIEEHQQPSVPTALSSSDPLLLSNLRAKVAQQRLRSRSGKSPRFSTKERPGRERNTGYAGRVHGCPEVN